MKIKIANAYDKETKSFDRNAFDLRESEKVINGRFTMSRKNKAEKWFSASMMFVAFKSTLSRESLISLLNHDGKSIDVKGELMVEQGNDGKAYFKFNIQEVVGEAISKHSVDKGNGYVSDEEDSSIPF